MLKHIMRMSMGWRTVHISELYAVKALNILNEYHFSHWNMKREMGGSICFCMTAGESRAFRTLCVSADIETEIDGVQGFPALFVRYKDRWGIFIGLLAAAVLIWQSTTVVWSVEVSGNKNVSEEKIREILRECGFTEGTRFGKIDFDLFQNQVLMHTEDISWIAVNMYGTTARVEIKERILGKTPYAEGVANIVAAEDGQIAEVRLKSGKAAAAIHDVVRKGDLLISGIMTVREGELRYEYAVGEVIAQVHRQIIAEVDLEQDVKVYTGQEYMKKTVIFFGKHLKFFQKGGIDTPTYDTIIESVRLCLPGGMELPVWVCTEKQCAYRMEREILTDAQAYDIAQLRFQAAVGELLAEAEILSLESTAVVEDGVCRIVGDAVCLKNIAQTVEIPIS